MPSERDKRLFPRRPAAAVPVTLSAAPAAGEFPGAVHDYSPSGLTVQVGQAVAAGAVLIIRRVRDRELTTPLELRVTQATAQEDGWRLGCRFDRTRHWDELRMFGD